MQVRQRSPETRVIILSMHSDESYVLEALPNGAAAYVLKESSADDLTWAVREVLQGRRYFSPPLSQLAIESYAANAQGVSVDVYKALTTREREVLHLAAEGRRSTEIADLLWISPRTVEGHRGSLMRKLQLRSQSDLIRYAIQRGIISSEL